MKTTWRPSAWGRLLTRSPNWELELKEDLAVLTIDNRTYNSPIDAEQALSITHGVIWSAIHLPPESNPGCKVDGLPNRQAMLLNSALWLYWELSAVQRWLDQVDSVILQSKRERRWITHETQQHLQSIRPPADSRRIRALAKDLSILSALSRRTDEIEATLSRFETDWKAKWIELNEAHVNRELIACKPLLDQAESKPLTEEQARAVICFDNRIQVIASAGSGKTSAMVAKAAYAIHRGLVKQERIVLLAFNKKAAEELQERAKKSFDRLTMTGASVEAATFHALGLSIIGKATGKKPDVPEWAIDPVSGFRKLTDIIDNIKDSSTDFRKKWDFFRFVLGQSTSSNGALPIADAWDESGKPLFVTARGDRVKSDEERMIANFLFYNGVNYKYEAPYEFDTADAEHRQYKPDFYYPEIRLYHEHFALNEKGDPPPHFVAYMDGVRWKRQLHKSRGTSLIETTSHGIRSGPDFLTLENNLTSRGVILDPNPDRPIPDGGQKPLESSELIGLIRTFISHAKSNCMTIEALHERLESMPKDTNKYRLKTFLEILSPIIPAWDSALSAENGIDFEDMLNMAAAHVESGRYESPYDLVMADEFQDASRARARLCRALVSKPGRHLFAVGDDWQSINRFAGADVAVMTRFKNWFGHGQTLMLSQTFRCPQELCDVSSRFVTKNPAQISKKVQSSTQPMGLVLQAFQVNRREEIADAVDRFLTQLCSDIRDGRIPGNGNRRLSVFVLGRYNAERAYVPSNPARFQPWIDVSFLTIHRSKGSEADYVILPAMISRVRGNSFPSTRSDDPVLSLAMPDGDDFPMGEERRLFYVALTRARRSVVMFSARGEHSLFLRELIKDKAISVIDTEGKPVKEETCPRCKLGVIVDRTGPYGEFKSCSNYPYCTYKPKKESFGRAVRSYGLR